MKHKKHICATFADAADQLLTDFPELSPSPTQILDIALGNGRHKAAYLTDNPGIIAKFMQGASAIIPDDSPDFILPVYEFPYTDDLPLPSSFQNNSYEYVQLQPRVRRPTPLEQEEKSPNWRSRVAAISLPQYLYHFFERDWGEDSVLYFADHGWGDSTNYGFYPPNTEDGKIYNFDIAAIADDLLPGGVKLQTIYEEENDESTT